MSNSIKILIAGEPDSGKSTIAYFLKMCLAKIGIDSVINDEQVSVELMEKTFQDRLKSIKENLDAGYEIDMHNLATEPVSALALPAHVRQELEQLRGGTVQEKKLIES